MPELAANLTTMFGEASFLDRFALARRAGFRAVEFQSPYDHEAGRIRERLSGADLRLVLFNAPAGDWAGGERGLAALPGRENEFRDGVALALDYALETGCGQVHVLAGVAGEGTDRAAMRQTYIDNLRYAAQFAALSGVAILIEPIGTQSMPGYFLDSLDMAADILDDAGEENLFIQYDLYHRSFAGPDLIGPYQRHADRIRHVQIAGWPGRHEPDIGEMAWRETLEELDVLGYAGFVGCEYSPKGTTLDGLGWAREWLRR